MDYYNTNATTLSQDHKISMLMAQVDDLRNVLGRNVHLLLERETKIDSLMEKSEQTRIDSLVFKKQSIRMKREQRNKSIKMSILIGGFFFLVFLYFLSIGIKYGWFQVSSS
jgi:Synaptobrevin